MSPERLAEPPDRSGAASAGAAAIRAVEIAGRAGFYGLLAGLRWLRAGGRRPTAIAGETLTDCCESLGATFIKMGQILSARSDLFPNELIRPLRRLQDDVAALQAKRLDRVVEQVFDRPPDEIFEQLDPEPLASASIAQVHRGVLRQSVDGIREVAVKLRRPGVARQIRTDLRLLAFGARLLESLPPLRNLPLRAAVAEVAAALEQQLDFVQEGDNNARFRQNLSAAERVRLPRVVARWSNRQVLVMELIRPLERLDQSSLDRAQLELGTLTGLRSLFRMIFMDGFIHADLHPGNVFFQDDGSVVMLDTGLVARLGGDDLLDFKSFFFGMVANDGRRCARVIERTAVDRGAGFESRAFREQMVALIAHHSRLVTEDFDVAVFVAALFDLQRRHQLRGSTAFTMAILSLAVYEGIVKQTHPTLDFQRQALAFFVKHRLNLDPALDRSSGR
ncbi:MAG: AarF/UbiB family protein [Acidobacteriota bacterium]